MRADYRLVDKIRQSSQYPVAGLQSLQAPLDRALWCLTAAADVGYTAPLSVGEIESILRDLEVSVRPSQMANALSRAGDLVIRYKYSTHSAFAISFAGRNRVKSRLGAGQSDVLHFEAGRQWTARQEAVQLINGLAGELRIVDRYYGQRTLEILDAVSNRPASVRFLTAEVGGGEKATAIQTQAKELMREHPNLEIRLATSGADFHDRYVISKDSLLLVGAGFKDLGKRESFVVLIRRDSASDLVKGLEESYAKRWSAANRV